MDSLSLLNQLVKYSFGELDDSTLNNYKGYFARLLNARTGASLMDDSDVQVEMARMQNKSQAFRLQECLNRLSKTRLRKKQEAIHFLFRCQSNVGNQTLDTLFKSQEISQTAITYELPRVSQVKQQPTFDLQLIQQIADKGNLQISISESDLIKDVTFAVQGIDGYYITFDPISDTFQVKKDVALSIPARKIINVMCECGWLFKKINAFQGATNNLVVQALQNSIKEELNEYYRLIAYFEQNENSLTLRQMYMWLKQPMHILTQINLLLSIVSTNTQQGSTSALIITTLAKYSKHGCPITSALFERLLHNTLIPLTRFINQWIFDGSLDDIAQEFFVERSESKVRDSGDQWKNEYRINPDKIPSMISERDCYKILDTGRVINWLRRQCRNQKKLDQELMSVDMLGTEAFTTWVLTANEKINKELITLIMPNFKVTLSAIKRFLLLGQGEFIHTLMEVLQIELSKPASQCYRHTLLALLESAFKNVSQEVRLNVKLLEPSQNDTGWEIFCLDYAIDEPLNTIFNGKIMLQYYRIFNFLWRVKRVEFTLSCCWKMHQKFMRVPIQYQYIRKALSLSQQMMNEMQHFIKNLYSYVMLEAVESPWKKFLDECERIKDLDSLIKLHEQFVSEVLDRAFLTQKGEQTQRLILKLFEYIFRFKSAQELLLSHAKDLLNQPYKNQPKQKNQEIVKSLLELRKQYRDQMFELQERLKREDRLKFLHFKLDFNEYYLGICESKLFNVDLERFIGMCLPKNDKVISSSRVQSSKQLIPPQPVGQISKKSPILPQQEFQEQVRSVKEGLKLLEEQRKQQLQLKEQFSKSPLSKSPMIPKVPTLTEHEKMKNDEDLISSSDDDLV